MGAGNLDKLFGVEFSELAHDPGAEIPPTTPGRVLHIDGDFLAYQVSADDTKTLADMKHNHDVAVEELRLLAGAEKVVSHLTASHGDKGNRFVIAVQKEYQANRKDKVKPKYLHHIKLWMHETRNAVLHEYQEADDGLCQANYNAKISGSPDLSVLVSKDKDLQMCPGWHLDWDEGELEFVDGYGYVQLDRSKTSPKIVGKGTSYFWSQMLTGDGADGIQGLPYITGDVLNAVKPTKAVLTALEVLSCPNATKKKKESAQKKLDARTPGKCGPVVAYDIVSKAKNDKQAFQLVKSLYQKTGDTVGFKHWRTGEDVNWEKVFVSEAKLLWMRRTPHENDVLDYFRKECQ